jgi:iron complex outermembrane recepter protein
MKLHSVVLATLILALPILAHADPTDDAQPGSSGSTSGGLEEIVVTAQRREQSLMTVPTSIQAVSGQELNNIGVASLGDLQFITPGFLPTTSSGYQELFIRGIGNSVFVGPDPSVATYIDDVPRIWGSMPDNLMTLDTSRVEILKGAQGGLYGRNATGGVVNVVTRQPNTETAAAEAQVSYGNLSTLKATVYFNLPVVNDTLAWNVAFERDSHDPYVQNIAVKNQYTAADFAGNGNVFGVLPLTPAGQAAFLNNFDSPQNGFESQNTYTANTKLRWTPFEHFSATLAGDYYYKEDTDGSQLQLATPAYTQGYVTGLNGLAGLGFTPNLPPGFVQQQRKWDAGYNTPENVGLKDWGSSLTAIYNAPFADFTSITAYRSQHTLLNQDLGAATVTDGGITVDNEKYFFYQELRAVSTNSGPIHWLGGGTYLFDHYGGATSTSLLGIFSEEIVHVDDQIKNYTIYGQAGYDITPELSLTSSVRYLKELNNILYGCCAGGAVFPNPQTLSQPEHAIIPSATLSYSIPDGNVYARWARGFKAGGFNPVASPSSFAGVPLSDGEEFGPEKVDTYEVGYKESLLNRRLQVTGDVFYNHYTGLQQTAHATADYQNAIILAIVNAGAARTYGAEGSVTYRVIDPVTVGANIGYLSAKYTNYVSPITTPQVLTPGDLSGTQMTNAPKWQMSFTAALDQPISGNLRLVGNVLVTYISTVLFDQSDLPCTGGLVYPACLPNAVSPGYWLTNLHVGVKTANDKYEVALFANNVFDRAYYTYGASDGNGNDLIWGAPRIFGVQLTGKY